MTSWVVVGLDNGGTANNATVLDTSDNHSPDGRSELCPDGGCFLSLAASSL
jgi:hypothetical protein